MVGWDQQPAVFVCRRIALANCLQADLDAVSHFWRLMVGNDWQGGCALNDFLQREIVGANDDHNGSDLRSRQRVDEMLDDRRAFPWEQQLRRAHSATAAGGGDQSEHAAGIVIHVAIRWGNRNHPGRLCLLEPKLAMPNISSNDCHPSALEPQSLLRDCSERRTRRSGPGGQHRNKVETAVVLRYEPTGTEAEGNERRSQAENRQVALFRLRVRLAVEFRTVRTPDQVPSELWRSRCPTGRISVNPAHADFPAMLAEAMDVLAACGFDIPSAAKTLTCTGSQLVKLLKDERSAFEQLARERAARGLPRLS